jgi:hypothetical protein
MTYPGPKRVGILETYPLLSKYGSVMTDKNFVHYTITTKDMSRIKTTKTWMNDANQSIRNPTNSGAIVDIQNDARTADLPPHEVKYFGN